MTDMEIKVPAKLVGIIGKDASCRIEVTWESELPTQARLVKWPEFIMPVLMESDIECVEPGKGFYQFEFFTLNRGRGKLEFRIGDQILEVPAVVFRESEFFLAMAISSNFHSGWDPLNWRFGSETEPLEGHAYPKTKILEEIYHQHRIPITWFIDKVVAETAAPDIIRWHQEFGDDYGVMPTSYFNHNEVNHNTKKTAEQTLDFVGKEVAGVEKNFPFGTGTLAVDQWIGSVGTNFMLAAYEMELHGLWGIGYDHRTCDTSMFHRGCPWDVYKPSKVNYRIPATHPSNLWIYQWTTRDIVNTIHTPDDGPGGSVIFSTDPDDIRNSEIMACQSDYYSRMLRNYKSNMDHTDFFVFLVHQEDHDCHFTDDADYLKTFLDDVIGEVTPATLEEISLWLNLKYSPEEHPSQALWVDDPLDCHEKVKFNSGVKIPADWPEKGAHYPPHVAYYGRESQWIIEEGHRIPIRWYDYTAQHQTDETGMYPEGPLPNVIIHSERFEHDDSEITLVLDLESDVAVSGLPFATWDVSFSLLMLLKERHASAVTTIGNCVVVRFDAEEGRRQYCIHLTESPD